MSLTLHNIMCLPTISHHFWAILRIRSVVRKCFLWCILLLADLYSLHICEIQTSFCSLQLRLCISVLVLPACWCVCCAECQVDPEQQEQASRPLRHGPASFHNPHLHGRFPWQPHPLQFQVYEPSPLCSFYLQQQNDTIVPFVSCNFSPAVIQRPLW